MLDPSTLIPWISPIITAVIMYIKTQGAQKAGDKAAEVIGEKATEMTMSTGQKALTLLRSRFSAKADRKAQQALANVEQDPNDDDYQQKLIKETARLASTDSTFAQELKKVQAENAHIPQSGSVTIDNRASNYGPQGVFYGSISFNHHITKDTHSE